MTRHGNSRVETEPGQDIGPTNVEIQPRPRHEKPRLETVSRQDTCLETPSLVHGACDVNVIVNSIDLYSA